VGEGVGEGVGVGGGTLTEGSIQGDGRQPVSDGVRVGAAIARRPEGSDGESDGADEASGAMQPAMPVAIRSSAQTRADAWPVERP
jgi:hypothetical protein